MDTGRRGAGPYGFVRIFKQTTAILLCVILSEATKARFSSQTRYRRSRFAVNGESKDLDRGKKPRARCEHAKLFLAKCYFACIELQRFCLDPTAAPRALWFARSLRFTSQTSTSRGRVAPFAQDDTDGMKSRMRTCPMRCFATIARRLSLQNGYIVLESKSPDACKPSTGAKVAILK